MDAVSCLKYVSVSSFFATAKKVKSRKTERFLVKGRLHPLYCRSHCCPYQGSCRAGGTLYVRDLTFPCPIYIYIYIYIYICRKMGSIKSL